jgi:hypothetical protein
VTRRDLRSELDAMADRWMADNHPDDDWPAVDEGRTRNTVSLSVAEMHADLAAIREGALDRPPLPESPDDPCTWCQLAEIKYRHSERHGRVVTDVCGRCHEYFRRHGILPPPKLNERHRRRMGATWTFPLMAVVMGTTTKQTKAERRAEQLWNLAQIREAIVDVCRAFADKADSRDGYLSVVDSQTWTGMLKLVRDTDALIAELRPMATRSKGFEMYAESRCAPPRPPRSR